MSEFMEQNHPKTLHMPQLEGLRAIAVLMVVWAHWAPIPYRSIAGADLGFPGVQMFLHGNCLLA